MVIFEPMLSIISEVPRQSSKGGFTWNAQDVYHWTVFGGDDLTLKWLGHFFQNVISFSDAVHLMCNIFIWSWSNTMNFWSALWILMAWCFSTRASVAIVLTTHPCVSRCLRVKMTATFSRGQWFQSPCQSYFVFKVPVVLEIWNSYSVRSSLIGWHEWSLILACHVTKCQAVIWISADLLSTGPIGTNFSDILIEIPTFLLRPRWMKHFS